MLAKRFTLLLLVTLLVGLSIEAPAQRRARPGWAPDGKSLLERGRPVDPITGEAVEMGDVETEPESPDARKPFELALSKALGLGFDAKTLDRRSRPSTLPRSAESPGMVAAEDGGAAAVFIDGDLWIWREGEKARKIRSGVQAPRHVAMSPDGGAVSYIADFNLYVTRLSDGETLALSKDGSEELFYGELDWVYQEEVYGRHNFQGAWWAPGGRHLAFMRIDEGGVDTFVVVDHIPNALETDYLKYPKAGSTNPRASLHLTAVATGRTVGVDLTAYSKDDEILVVRVGWTPEGDEAICMIQNREQTWLDLLFVDPETGKSRRVIHEESEKAWVNVLAMPSWLKDGSFIWESERTGFKHLYRFDRQGKLLATITSGDWQVNRIDRLDEERGWVAFSGTKDSAVGPHVYRVDLDGKNFVRLTDGRGTHQISLNAEGDLLIDSFSSLESPSQTWLRRADGTAVRQLSGPKPDAPKPSGVVPQLHRIPTRDGDWLDVTVRVPDVFDPESKYPVFIYTYSGPDAPTVSDSWRGTAGGFWSDHGIIQLQVNVRTASGRGMKYTGQCYRQFGVQELKDLEDAIDWLCDNHSWADAERVGITGWSYGGYMTAYAMTHSKKFKCGVAGGGVYDWRLYDTIYTERYMAKPQNNEDGYALSSVVTAAGDLHGELLIVHGTMDDNVHLQNAIQFVHALQEAGKLNFQVMYYAKSRHGVRSRHLVQLREKFILENL
ncbi:MAG: DPP IV N-terminal domain-containing protein [Planctomycetes bacterium]|nr:DPP IV N-terminal domain-containing protein [Planctomycetota bacterium]